MKAILLLLCLTLIGCSGSATQAGTTPPPATAAVADPTTAPESNLPSAPDAAALGEVNYACQTDADCAVKDVGNCCGYYPACVNTVSPTFPEQVKADCAKEGRMAVCGFPNITGCECVEGRCSNLTGPGDGSPLQ